MDIAPFETEHFFARHEFTTDWQLCNSDCETVSIAELLEMAGDSLEGLGRERLGYTQTAGEPALRQAIADIYQQVSPDSVLVLGSPVEGIYLAARALLKPGDEVVVTVPAYDALVNLCEHVAGPEGVHRWRFRASGSRWALDLDELRGLLTPKTRLLVVNFPHNPTGFYPSREWQDQLALLAAEHELAVFCDEMYSGLVHSGTPPVPSLADVSDRAVILSGLSKTHGLPGLRCGWLIVNDPVLWGRLHNWKHYTSICSPVPSVYLSLAALRARDTLCARNISRIEHNLTLADRFFEQWQGLFDWRRPLAGSTALVGFDVPSVSALSERLARDQNILIQSAAMLGGSDREMRLGFGRDNFQEALGRFDRWLRRNEGRV